MKIFGCKERNKVLVDGEIPSEGEVHFKSDGCNLIIHSGVKLHGVNIVFHAPNASLEIGEDSVIRGQIHLGAEDTSVSIGSRLRCNSNIFINLAEKGDSLRIGNDCLFANVRFRTSDSHQIFDVETMERLNPSGNIIVEDKVWIAEDVLVLKNTHIKSNSVVGEKSLVNSTLAANSLSAGIPAKVRRSNIIWR